MEFDQEPGFAIHYLENPERIVVDLSRVTFGFEAEELKTRGLITSLRYGDSGNERSRLILGMTGPVALETAAIEAIGGGAGYRLVLDVSTSDANTFAELVSSSDWNLTAKGSRRGGASLSGKPFTIVIDPGHGGIDGGAEGVHGTKEKDVTLAFAEALVDALEGHDDMDVTLTRTDDSFVSLSGRLRQAHAKNADLFLSLHADSIGIRRLRGATVYTLSDKASDAVAAALAAQDNHNETMLSAGP